MPRNSSPLIVVVALVVIGLILAALNVLGNTSVNPNIGVTPNPLNTPVVSPTISPTPTLSASNPDTSVTQFYTWYLSQTPPIPAADYQASPYLSDTLKTRLASMSSVSIVNTLLCGNQNPLTFTATTVGTPTSTSAQVNVEQVFPTGSRLIPLSLIKSQDMWQINTITCTRITPLMSPTVLTPTVSVTPTVMPTTSTSTPTL